MKKEILRRCMLSQRNKLSSKVLKFYSHKIFSNYLKLYKYFKISKNTVVSGYYPINSEANDLFILNHLRCKQHKVMLPIINQGTKILSFGDYNNNLIKSSFNIKQPTKKIDLLPDIILAPLVAFDDYGNRVGYGGGYYDSTLSYCRLMKDKVIYVGIGYSFQRVDRVFTDSHDIKLDTIITEKNISFFR